jgi:hypothetical protein
MPLAQVYLVRVWTPATEPAGFRAAVRAVEREESRLFTSAEDVGAYLAAQLAPAPSSASGPAPAGEAGSVGAAVSRRAPDRPPPAR